MPDDLILIASGDRESAEQLRSILAADGFACRVEGTPEGAVDCVRSKHPPLAIIDDRFTNGISLRLVADLREIDPSLAVIFCVGERDAARALEACRAGACDFLTKPFHAEKTPFRVQIALGRRRLNVYEISYRMALEERVNERTRELWDKQEKIRSQVLSTISALVTALQAKHDYTGEHSRRVADVALALARYLELSEEETRAIELASLFHDIGKIGIRDTVLNKAGHLTPDEYDHVKQHPLIAEQILAPIEDFSDLLSVVKHEHERFDGSGYPSGLIPLGARIIAIADTYDALVTDRSYRKGCAKESAVEEIRRCAGSQFDPRLVDAFVQVLSREESPGPRSRHFTNTGVQAPVRLSPTARPNRTETRFLFL
jgi:response regulator RpfG family c-di-GMP phosphodiesterase